MFQFSYIILWINFTLRPSLLAVQNCIINLVSDGFSHPLWTFVEDGFASSNYSLSKHQTLLKYNFFFLSCTIFHPVSFEDIPVSYLDFLLSVWFCSILFHFFSRGSFKIYLSNKLSFLVLYPQNIWPVLVAFLSLSNLHLFFMYEKIYL